MTIECARAQTVEKPWGVPDLRPWSRADNDGSSLVGEIWYERPGTPALNPSLLLKLLFTSQPLQFKFIPTMRTHRRWAWRTARRKLGTS